jgi:sugar lactone lactonase YvrE
VFVFLAILVFSCGGETLPDQQDASPDVADAFEVWDTPPADIPVDPAMPGDEADLPPDAIDDAFVETELPPEDIPNTDVAPSLPPTILAVDLALEGDGSTALVTTLDSLLLRVDLATMQATRVLAWGMSGPAGVAIEAGGGTALVAQTDAGRLDRVDLTTGQRSMLATGLVSPRGVAIEASGTTALVVEANRLSRVDLGSGATLEISHGTSEGYDVVIEAGGATALVVESGQVLRVTLATGAVSPVAVEGTVDQSPFWGGITLSVDGTWALVNTAQGCLAKVNLATGTGQRIGCLFGPGVMALALEAGEEWALLGEDGKVVRVHLASETAGVQVGPASFEWVEVEASGTSALLAGPDVGGGAPHLWRVDLATGDVSAVATLGHFYGITGMVLEPGGATALVMGYGSQDWSYSGPRLVRADLATGESTVISSLFEGNCSGIALEAGGDTALVSCWTLYRVDRASGAVSVVTAEFPIGGIDVDVGGSFALASAMSGRELWHVGLPEGTLSQVGRNLFVVTSGSEASTDVVIEPGGATALVTQTGLGGAYYQDTGRLVRVDLATGSVTVLVPGGWTVLGLALEPGGTSALAADTLRGLIRVTLPAVQNNR